MSNRLAWTLTALLAVALGAVTLVATTPTPTAEPVAVVAPVTAEPLPSPTYGPDELFAAVLSQNAPEVGLQEARTMAMHVCADLDRGTPANQATAAAFANHPPMEQKAQSVIAGTASAFCPAHTEALSAEARRLYPRQVWAS